jgi:hypothetical protein
VFKTSAREEGFEEKSTKIDSLIEKRRRFEIVRDTERA